MGRVYELIRELMMSEEGATAVEYAITAAAIAAVIAITVFQLGIKVHGLFSDLNAEF